MAPKGNVGRRKGTGVGVSGHLDGSQKDEIPNKIKIKGIKKGAADMSSKCRDGSAELSFMAKEKKQKYKKKFMETDGTPDGDLKGNGFAERSGVNRDADDIAFEVHKKAEKEKKRLRK